MLDTGYWIIKEYTKNKVERHPESSIQNQVSAHVGKGYYKFDLYLNGYLRNYKINQGDNE
jgi:hypothetical protein